MSKTVKITLIVLAVLGVIAVICIYSINSSSTVSQNITTPVDTDLLASTTDTTDTALDADFTKIGGQLSDLDTASADVNESLK